VISDAASVCLPYLTPTLRPRTKPWAADLLPFCIIRQCCRQHLHTKAPLETVQQFMIYSKTEHAVGPPGPVWKAPLVWHCCETPIIQTLLIKMYISFLRCFLVGPFGTIPKLMISVISTTKKFRNKNKWKAQKDKDRLRLFWGIDTHVNMVSWAVTV